MRYWFREHEQYRTTRRELILHHIGSAKYIHSLGVKEDKAMMANLIQLTAQAHMVTLAYGNPKYKYVSNVPEADHVAPRLQATMNRWSDLLSLGDIARALALDSFFGYGIAEVYRGILPAAVQAVVKQQQGPLVERISQDCFLFDGDATEWARMPWAATIFTVPLFQAQRYAPFLEYNEEGTMNLQEMALDPSVTNSRMHSMGGRRTSMPMVRLVRAHLPDSNCRAIWPCGSHEFTGVSGKPLLVEEYQGHHEGPYTVLSHLDIPDNLLPVPQIESVRRLHVLFNELADQTADQATMAKINPVYEIGAQRDMQRLVDTKDREPVAVSDITKIGTWERPGPTQSQTSYMMGVLQMFKEFAGNLDDTLGLGPTAKTATQSELIRSRTSAAGAEKRRKMDRMMIKVAEKLSHLFLTDQTIRVPVRERLGNTDLPIDNGWEPPNELPRRAEISDYSVTIVPYTLEYRDPAVRIAQFNEASMQIFQAFQLAAQGVPIDLEQYIELQAEYRDLPELRKVYAAALPQYKQQVENAQMRLAAQRTNVGEYTRTNRSEANADGQMRAAFEQQMGPTGGGIQGVQR